MTAEELLAAMAEPLAEAGTYCTIDPETRVITIPPEYQLLGVESDEKAERIHFKCPKIVGDDIDLSKLALRVNFRNAGRMVDQYRVDDVAVDGDNITFSWLLSRRVTQYEGDVNFIVCAVKVNDDATITNEWNTTLATAQVLEGLEVDYLPEEEEQARDLLKELILEATKQIEDKAEKTLETIPEDYTTAAQNALSAKNEVEDIRVGADGRTYTSAGEAVRRQFDKAVKYLGFINESSSNPQPITDLNNFKSTGYYHYLKVLDPITKLLNVPEELEGLSVTATILSYPYGDILTGGYFGTQFMICSNGYVFHRTCKGDKWQTWTKEVNMEELEDQFDKAVKYLGFINESSSNPQPITDLNNFKSTGYYHYLKVLDPITKLLNVPEELEGLSVTATILSYPYGDILTGGYFGTQFMICSNGYVFHRTCKGDKWQTWTKEVNMEELEDQFDKAVKYLGFINAASDTPIITDLNDIVDTGYYQVSISSVDYNKIANFPPYFETKGSTGILLSLPYGYISSGLFFSTQIMTTDFGRVFTRVCRGSWGNWTMGATIDDVSNTKNYIRSCDIFTKVCCCGDSYTSGYINNGEEEIGYNENFAWPKYMSKITGNEYINCGSSGATVRSWLTRKTGLPKAIKTGKVQAYIIGLGINDSGTTVHVPLGTIEDIGLDNSDTYYAGLSKIIRELNAISPKAKIFVQTMAKAGSRVPDQDYNDAIRNVVNAYANIYPVHLLDLDAYSNLYDIPEISEDYIHGHQTGIGYRAFAENLAYIMSKYINEHIEDFQDVYLIPTE